MSRVRVSLTGTALEAADRILAQTPIEGYSELFSFLLRRYEQDFITACNGFLVPQVGQPVPPVAHQTTQGMQLSPQQGHTVPSVPTVAPHGISALPKNEHANPQEPLSGQVDPHQSKSAKQMLMDFDD